jgi:hypothetical protein
MTNLESRRSIEMETMLNHARQRRMAQRDGRLIPGPACLALHCNLREVSGKQCPQWRLQPCRTSTIRL